MTSEPDNKPSWRPPTIELKATEIGQPDAAAPPGASGAADTPPPKSSNPTATASRLKSHAVGAIVGAMAIVAIIAGLRLAGIVPSRQDAAVSAAAPETAAAPSAAEGDISARLDRIERTIQTQHGDPALTKRVVAAEVQSKALSETLTALNRRLDDIAATSQAAAEAAKTASANASQSASAAANDAANKAATQAASQAASQVASQINVQKSDLDALAGRIAALESAVKALSENAAHPAEGANDQAARLTIAAEALRAAVERSAPYQAELTAVQSLGVEQSATAPLAAFAATGVPSAVALAHELAALMPDLRHAAEPSVTGSTFLGRLEVHAEHLVRITPVEAPAGNAPSAVIARIATDAAHADITAALTDIAALPETAKPLAADWVAKANARAAAMAAARQIAAGALASLSKPASQ